MPLASRFGNFAGIYNALLYIQSMIHQQLQRWNGAKMWKINQYFFKSNPDLFICAGYYLYIIYGQNLKEWILTCGKLRMAARAHDNPIKRMTSPLLIDFKGYLTAKRN